MEQTPARPWYQKKRYIIPLGVIATAIALANIAPGTTIQSSQQTDAQTATALDAIEATLSSTTASEPLPTPSDQRAVEQKSNPFQQPEVRKNTVPVALKPAPKQQDSSCNPNYSGCLRTDASDYDCAGGSGNGPYYTGRVRVLRIDVYGLDRDGDGWGCD